MHTYVHQRLHSYKKKIQSLIIILVDWNVYMYTGMNFQMYTE